MSNSNYPGIDYSGPGSTANRDTATGIRYGVISQHSIQPDVMSDIWSEARDLSYEAAKEELLDQVMRHVVMPRDSDGETRSERWNDVKAELRDLWYGEGNEPARNEATTEITTIFDSEGRNGRESVWSVIEDRFNDRYEDNGERSWLWEKDGYSLRDCLTTDVFVSKSPYFTYAQFCSPCVPGAGNLDHPCEKWVVFSPEETKREDEEMFWSNQLGWVSWGDHTEFDVKEAASMAPAIGGEWHPSGEWPRVFCLGHDFFDGGEAPYPVFSVATGKRVVMVEKKEGCPICGGSGRDSITRLAEVRGHPFEVVYRDIMRGETKVDGFDENLGTFKCFRCGGLGYEVKKVQEEQ